MDKDETDGRELERLKPGGSRIVRQKTRQTDENERDESEKDKNQKEKR